MAADAVTPDARVVIVHDFMETFGGAERVTAELARAFPSARVVAILGRRDVAARMGVADRFESLLSPRRRLLERYRLLAPAYPLLAASRRLAPADVVIASSYAFAHGFRTRNDAPRLCYSWGPLRFAWSMSDDYRRHWAGSAPSRLAFDGLTAWMRAADRRAARGVDRFIAPLRSVAERLHEAYGAESEIIGPPIDGQMFSPNGEPPGDHYLFCGRLVEPYKRTISVIEAFNALGARLLIAGDGPARPELEAVAGPKVEFRGQLGDAELVAAMRGAKAVISASSEDFGLVVVEAMACGRPVLAYAGGGAIETVAPGVTGELFTSREPDAIAEAVRAFDPSAYDPAAIREHALRWDAPRFRERIRGEVGGLIAGGPGR